MRVAPVSHHMVFVGPPGTGKTTAARLLGRIYSALGVLEKGHLREAAHQDLVAEYVGQTAIKTNQVIDDGARRPLVLMGNTFRVKQPLVRG